MCLEAAPKNQAGVPLEAGHLTGQWAPSLNQGGFPGWVWPPQPIPGASKGCSTRHGHCSPGRGAQLGHHDPTAVSPRGAWAHLGTGWGQGEEQQGGSNQSPPGQKLEVPVLPAWQQPHFVISDGKEGTRMDLKSLTGSPRELCQLLQVFYSLPVYGCSGGPVTALPKYPPPDQRDRLGAGELSISSTVLCLLPARGRWHWDSSLGGMGHGGAMARAIRRELHTTRQVWARNQGF